MSTKLITLPQYTVTFLAGSFGLTSEQARMVIAQAGGDRVKAAEGARLQKQSTSRTITAP